MRAFGDGPRNFWGRDRDADDTRAGTSSPKYHTTPTERRLSSKDLTCIVALHGGSLWYGVRNPDMPAMIRYLDHWLPQPSHLKEGGGGVPM
ncbi:hypothetical protein TNCV_2868581 [Trichonephila clavipes]|nr:hypothetical protein TNCV_2868581 [Trichonephila clavipes]